MATSNNTNDDPSPDDLDLDVEVQRLTPRAIFGLNGTVHFGLQIHPSKQHIIFPLGMKIGVQDLQSNKQEFIAGHTNNVSCLDISETGRYMASGQINHMGFPGFVIIWDFAERKEIARHNLHKVRVQTICFSASEKYVFSAGGRDDGAIIAFDLETFTPFCRCVAARAIGGNALYICALTNNPNFFVVGGDRHLRIWNVIKNRKKMDVSDVFVGKQQRMYVSICVDQCDTCAYLGTMTGDIVKISLDVTENGCQGGMLGAFGTHNPRKPYGKDCNRYVNGVRALILVKDGLLLLGAGDGVIELVEERKDVHLLQFKDYPSPTWPVLRTLKHGQVNGAVSSIVKINALEYYIGTHNNEIYHLNLKSFNFKLLKTCHSAAVNDVCFPKNMSSVFATAGYESIRVWSTKRLQELLRIVVYNFYCAAIAFTNDGSSIVSAWNDGVIRAFTPITGRLIYAIPNAHNKGCSALCISANGRIIVTGGTEGQVRVWKIEPYRQSLIGVLKDHSGPISTLDLNHLDTEVISACCDGSCVIWDIKRMTRKLVITSNTQFLTARYFPSCVQMLTCGTDGRITYWMVYNGGLIRELEGAKKSSVNYIAINRTGDYFVSVDSDMQVKLWDYNRGIVLCQGNEHSASIISASFSPCGKFFVTCSIDGCVIIWDVPEPFWGKEKPPPAEVSPIEPSLPKVSSARSVQTSLKNENIGNLVANTPKGNVCCIECPPVDMRRKPAEENCDFVPDVRKC